MRQLVFLFILVCWSVSPPGGLLWALQYNTIYTVHSNGVKTSIYFDYNLKILRPKSVFKCNFTVLPTWLLVGHLPAQGSSGCCLLGRDSDRDSPLSWWRSVFDRLCGESSAVSPTEVDLVGWNWNFSAVRCMYETKHVWQLLSGFCQFKWGCLGLAMLHYIFQSTVEKSI